jgi:hypothetical protein
MTIESTIGGKTGTHLDKVPALEVTRLALFRVARLESFIEDPKEVVLAEICEPRRAARTLNR